MKAVGEEFIHRGKTIVVVEDIPLSNPFGGCDACFFKEKKCDKPHLECRNDYRDDNIPVHFEEVK